MKTHLSIDQINIALMVSSCAVAYLLPFELVLISYAFLGPAHYLTQISWLHDRTYFTGEKWAWIPLGLIVLALMALTTPGINFVLMSLALAICAGLALAKRWVVRGAIMVGLMALLLSMRGIFPPSETILIMLLPTVVHIYVFTGLFILLGALKSGSKWGLASFAVFVACGVSFFFLQPSDFMLLPAFTTNNLNFFEPLANYLAYLLSFGGHVDGQAMLGFLSFAYTYHYLNWFSKTEVIKWHQIPKRRFIVIITLYLVSIGLYLFDYKTGFMALLFLSLLHVVLEFPLDIITMRTLGQSLFKKRVPAQGARPAP